MQRSLFFRCAGCVLGLAVVLCGGAAVAQSNSATVSGSVADASGAVIPGAKVVIANPVSGYTRTVESDPAGNFQFFNVPFNPYSLTVTESRFSERSARPYR